MTYAQDERRPPATTPEMAYALEAPDGYDPARAAAWTQAESLVRPFLETGAIWGVTPIHRFRNREMDPLRLVEAITEALLTAQKDTP